MSVVLGGLTLLLHAALMLAVAPFVPVVPRLVRARLAGARGPALIQPWRDLVRLMRKDPVVAEHASFLVPAAPFLCLAVTMVAALLVPSFALGMASAPAADLLVLFLLLAVARALPILAAIDAGAPGGGAAAGQALGRAVLAEPALFLVVLAFALLSGGTNLDQLAGFLRDGTALHRAGLLLALAALLMLGLGDTGRTPLDDPDSGQEPAMGPAGLALDYAGPHLACLQLAAGLRLTLWLSLLATLLLPDTLAPELGTPFDWAAGIVFWAGKMIVLALLLGLAEALVPRLRAGRQLAAQAVPLVLALLAALLFLLGGGAA